MLKQYKILVNEGKGSDNALITVPAGAGARGNPTRIMAKPDARYELQDELKGKGLGPDQVRGKRVGKSLYLMFEDNGKPDVIIEGYYDPINLQQGPSIVGKAENGSIYEYIPHDPELSSMTTSLKDGSTPAMLSLGGGPIAADGFVLAALPMAAAAAVGGGLGGLGWVAAGLGAAALGGGGGGGGAKDTTPPSKPTSFVIPENTNGGVNAKEAEDGSTLEVGLPADALAGDVLKTVITKPDGTKITLDPITLTAAMIAAKTVTQIIPASVLKGDGQWTTSSTLTDAAGNVSAPIDGTFTLDTIAPTPLVAIDTDKNNDVTISSNEIISSAATVDVSATFADKANLKVGDKLKFTDSVSGTNQEVTFDAAMVAAGVVKTTFKRPNDGVSLSVTAVLTDIASNPPVTSNTDIAVMGDTTPPTPLGGGLDCYLKHDTDNDTGASQTDSITQKRTPTLVGKVEANASVSVLVNGVAYTTKADSNGDYAVSVNTALADGPYTPEVTATDASGNSQTTEGTPFYVDNRSDVNQKPTKDLPDTNTAATVNITVITEDTKNAGDVNSTASDFITSDNTLIYKGTVPTFDNNGDYVKLDLKDSTGAVVATTYVKPNNLTWEWDRTGVTQADGKYTLDATIVDAAGNMVNPTTGTDSQVIYISNKALIAVADDDGNAINSPGLIQAVEAGHKVAGNVGSGNVLANDKNDVLGYSGNQSLKTVKLVGSTTGSVVGSYGTLSLASNGAYTYKVDDTKQVVDSLNAGVKLTESFSYEVTDFTGQTSQTTMKVSVVGSNDQAKFGGVTGFNLIGGTLNSGPLAISISDPDLNQDVFASPVDLRGTYGDFLINNTNQNWSYARSSVVQKAGVTVHDLLVVTSLDASAATTLDVSIQGTGAITQHEYNTKTTAGLNISGTSVHDVLKITGSGQTLDLTNVIGAVSNLNSIEEIDLQSSTNSLRINLDDLTQADGGLLYVDSTGNSLVTFVNGTGVAVQSAGTSTRAGLTYNIYRVDSTHELLVQNTINQIFFSAT
jgi:VCBS repeat-containing protein